MAVEVRLCYHILVYTRIVRYVFPPQVLCQISSRITTQIPGINRVTDFGRKRENAVSTNERLQQEAQAVLDVIENLDVAQALRQDKNQNLQ